MGASRASDGHATSAPVAAVGTPAAPLTRRQLGVGAHTDPVEAEADRFARTALTTGGTPTRRGPRGQDAAVATARLLDAAGPADDRSAAERGAPLSSSLRADMGRRFGHDFSTVRIHTGQAAERSARDLDASAYSLGDHIVFAGGRFAPGTDQGRRLIAHELAHVVQHADGHASSAGPPMVHRAPPGGAKDTKPLDLDNPATRGRVFELPEAQEWATKLEKQGYTVYIKKRGDFTRSDLLKGAFRDQRAGPDLVAINPAKKRILVGDITAGAWSTAEPKPGDLRTQPNDLPVPQETPHLSKTVSDARQLARNLPPAFDDYTVVARDRYREDIRAQYSVEVTVRAPLEPAVAGGRPGTKAPAATTPVPKSPAGKTPAVETPAKSGTPHTAAPTPAPRIIPGAPKPSTAKAPTLRRPRLFPGGRGGNLVGLLIVIAASLIAGKAEAAQQQTRYESDLKALEPQIAAKLAGLTDRVATMQALDPMRTVYLNVTVHVATFEMFLAMPDGAFESDVYMGTTLGGVGVSHQDIASTRHERDGSAARGGTEDLEITTSSDALEQYTVEELIAHARATGLDLGPLRRYVTSLALLEESRTADVSVSPESQYSRDRWVRALRAIDAPP